MPDRDITSKESNNNNPSFSVVLGKNSPDLLEDQYRIDFGATTQSLRLLNEIKSAGQNELTVYLVNMVDGNSHGFAPAINYLADLSDYGLGSLAKRVTDGDQSAKHLPGTGLYFGRQNESESQFQAELKRIKGSLMFTAHFDLSGIDPKLTVTENLKN